MYSMEKKYICVYAYVAGDTYIYTHISVCMHPFPYK